MGKKISIVCPVPAVKSMPVAIVSWNQEKPVMMGIPIQEMAVMLPVRQNLHDRSVEIVS